MDIFDDMLNIFGYLKQRQQESAGLAHEAYEHLQAAKSDNLFNEIHSLTEELKSAARGRGILLSDTSHKINTVPAFDAPLAVVQESGSIKERFQALLEEAHSHGFVNVQPEDVLSYEQIRRAEQFESQLDAEFSRITSLQGKDLQMLFLATALQILRHVLQSFLSSNPSSDTFEEGNVDVASVQTGPPLSTWDGLANTVFGTGRIFSSITASGSVFKAWQQILHDPIPFDLDVSSIGKSVQDIWARHKYAGWFFGTANLLTDTLSMRPLLTYRVDTASDGIYLGDQVSPVNGLLTPLSKFHSDSEQLESLAAAVIRQAYYLDSNRAPDALSLFEENMEQTKALRTIDPSFCIIPELRGHLVQFGLAGMVNAVIMALHALQYDKQTDGTTEQFSLRTMKILNISCLLATAVNSIPAAVTSKLECLDWGGALMTLSQSFSSIRYWINLKTDFLFNVHSDKMREMLTYTLDFIDKHSV